MLYLYWLPWFKQIDQFTLDAAKQNQVYIERFVK